ncbi:hypothetical protein BDW71DRAFT_105753 [Aspergillus fruticulosus]
MQPTAERTCNIFLLPALSIISLVLQQQYILRFQDVQPNYLYRKTQNSVETRFNFT